MKLPSHLGLFCSMVYLVRYSKCLLNAIVIMLVVCVGFFYGEKVQADNVVAMNYETQAIDLDTGTITEVIPGASEDLSSFELRFAYHADRSTHAVAVSAVPELNLEMAFVDNMPFDEIDILDVAALTFTNGILDHALEANDTVIVRAVSGAIFKVGNLTETNGKVSFYFSQLQ
jgi:hypothetical protein